MSSAATQDARQPVRRALLSVSDKTGLVELALSNCPAGPVRDWLRAASEAFERERLYLVRLTAAVGPLPQRGSCPSAVARSATRSGLKPPYW